MRRAGHHVAAVSAVSQASRDRAEEMLPGVPIRPVDEVVAGCHLVFLTIPDDALPQLVSGLAALGTFPEGQIVVHTAGRYGTSVLAPAGPTVVPLALHPAMTFTGTPIDLSRLLECYFAVTSSDLARPLAEMLVVELGGTPLWVAEEDRGTYHLALAHGANHLVTVIAQSLQLLSAAGIPEPRDLLRPLVEAALDNALLTGDGALTGPVARGDVGTLAQHLALVAHQPAEIRTAYRALALATTRRAMAAGRLAPQLAEPILALLANGDGNADPPAHQPPEAQ